MNHTSLERDSTVLYATELRENQDRDVIVVAQVARARQASVTLLHVMEMQWRFSQPFLEEAFYRHHRQHASERSEDVQQLLVNAEVQCGTCMLKTGSVVEEILDVAQSLGSSLIALGAGDVELRGGPGMTALAVMESAPQSVLIVQPGRQFTQLKTILCPVDHSRPSRFGLEEAIRLARGANARLIVLSIIPEVSWLAAAAEVGQFKDAKEEYEAQWAEGLDEFLAVVDFDGVSWTQELERGASHEQIPIIAKKVAADLIVMGATGRTGLVRTLLGSTTRRVLRELPCSILVVREQKDIDPTA